MHKVLVASRHAEGHRRAGRFIPPEQIEIEVSDAHLAELKADRYVVLVELAASAPAKPEPVKPEPAQQDAKPSKK